MAMTHRPARWLHMHLLRLGAAAACAACVLPAGAQIANPAAQGTTTVAAAQAPAAPAPSAAAATPATAASAPRPMLYYVCGKAGLEHQVTSPDPHHPFNLGVSFAAANGASPASDVAVKVRRHGRVLMQFVAAGPHCLFSVPDAEYRVEGTYQGEMKFDIVQTGNLNAQLRW